MGVVTGTAEFVAPFSVVDNEMVLLYLQGSSLATCVGEAGYPLWW